MTLSASTRARLDALTARGCAVVGPVELAPEHGEPRWECVVVLPDAEEMKGRGPTDEDAAVAAATRAEGAPQLDLLEPKDE